MSAVFLPAEGGLSDEDRYEAMAPLFADCNVVVVEGDSQTSSPKIEVWRAIQQTAPLSAEDSSTQGVVADDSPPISTLVLPRADVPRSAQWLLERLPFEGLPPERRDECQGFNN